LYEAAEDTVCAKHCFLTPYHLVPWLPQDPKWSRPVGKQFGYKLASSGVCVLRYCIFMCEV